MSAQSCYSRGSSHLVGRVQGVTRSLLCVVLGVWALAGGGVFVARGNRSVVLCGASGDVPEIDL